MKKIILALIVSFNVLMTAAWAETFIVQNIEVQGLQRISSATVYSYLPIKRGQQFNAEKSAEVIRALYKTGFFENITIGRSGNTLVINVTERSTIGLLKISGNSVIPTDKLTNVMKSLDIAEGRVYNRLMVERIRQSLLNQYYELGRYNARVDVAATPMERNRMLVKIDISEGLVAKIRNINIIGNKAFSEKTLQKQLTVSPSSIFTVINQKDRYSQEKLDESIENLRNFYLDNGYIKFAIKSSQVAITPDRKSIYLTIVVEEGDQYRIKGIDVKGDTIITREDVIKSLNVKEGDVFSRKAIMAGEKSVNDKLGDKGYIFSTISLDPKIDETKKEVFLTFVVKPGKRAYVRHIYFSDNAKTNDVVLRREIQQMESAPVSTSKLEVSKQRLSLMPYIKDVQMSVKPIEGQDDQVDVNYKVTEESAAQANVTMGYSQQNGIQFGAGLNQKNFLGTGKTLGFNFTKNRFEQFYSVNYTNPYYTPDGVSRTIGMSAMKVNPGKTNTSASYTMNQYGASVLYSIPIGQEKGAFNRFQFGFGAEDSLINLTDGTEFEFPFEFLNPIFDPVSREVRSFVRNHGRRFTQVDFISGFSRDSRDKAIFPTRGSLQTIGLNMFAPVRGGLSYFISSYSGKIYYPLSTSGFILMGKAQAGFGSGIKGGAKDFPFFKYFYAGGIDSVRGYVGNTLGPRDSKYKPTGGNASVTGTVALIVPNHISDNLRTSIFADAGNVYNTYNVHSTGGTGSGPVRASVGVDAAWLTMFGMIDVAFAKPLNAKKGSRTPYGSLNDYTEPFQFSLGANFG